MPLSNSLRDRIRDLVQSQRVVLFMKGTRHAPRCGFSSQVVQVLEAVAPDFRDVDVLADSELREGIKEYSEWPTIPQLFIEGKFIGGADIVRELQESGELEQLLGVAAHGAEPVRPDVRITEAAAKAFAAALGASSDESLHLRIDAGFRHDLYVGPREGREVEANTGGLALLLDATSAGRAHGMTIDFVSGEGGGFKIDNPNEPPKVKKLSVRELRALLDRGEVELFDVRPDGERALASIGEARSLDPAGQDYLFALDRARPIAFLCHHGVRSRNAAERVLSHGFRTVYNVEGGIAAWSDEVDPSVPQY